MASSGGQHIFILWSFIVLLFGDLVASQEHNCSQVKCPPTSSYHCPEDSYALETNEFTAITTDEEHHIVEEVLVHCCVTKMCACRTCDIPSCHNTSLVLIETEKGSDIPGKCCSKYKCDYEPNCDEVINTYGHWLVDCQRCECLAGQRICHRSCDEVGSPPSSCLSQNLKKMFSHGDTWKEDGCTQCQCHFGTLKCQTSFCSPLNCAKKTKLPEECCQICVEETSTIVGDNIDIATHSNDVQSTSETIDTGNSQKPCGIPEFLPTRQNCILYGIIVALSIILVVFIGLYYHEKSKQRSYKPVSVLDDNFNKITGKIKSKEFTYA